MPYIQHKIKCPRHFILRKGADPFLRVHDPMLNGVSDDDLKRFKISRWKIKRGANGLPIRNPESYYQPEISSTFAIEHIFDPCNFDCKYKCRGRCLEGQGKVNVKGIKRLHG